jgi:hypothetical protein
MAECPPARHDMIINMIYGAFEKCLLLRVGYDHAQAGFDLAGGSSPATTDSCKLLAQRLSRLAALFELACAHPERDDRTKSSSLREKVP